MPAVVLIDYYNLPNRLTRSGPSGLWNRLQPAVTRALGQHERSISLRLYGGWYDDKGLTRDGDRFARDIGQGFPLVLRHPSGLQRIHCEIVSSLLINPNQLFPATVRTRRGLRRGTSARRPRNCNNLNSCSIFKMRDWLRGQCPERACPVTSDDVFRRREQKLVDSLISCDLITIAHNSQQSPALLVTEDDDLVPAMLLALHLGGLVYHVRTVAGRHSFYDQMLLRSGVRTIAV